MAIYERSIYIRIQFDLTLTLTLTPTYFREESKFAQLVTSWIFVPIQDSAWLVLLIFHEL